MLKNIAISIILSSSLLLSMSVSQVNEATTEGLGCIKGIGVKKLQRIIEYKKENPIQALDDLLKIKGIGKVILKNIKEDVIKKSCKQNKKKSTVKKATRQRKKINAE